MGACVKKVSEVNEYYRWLNATTGIDDWVVNNQQYALATKGRWETKH
jgi:hypothetical protein